MTTKSSTLRPTLLEFKQAGGGQAVTASPAAPGVLLFEGAGGTGTSAELLGLTDPGSDQSVATRAYVQAQVGPGLPSSLQSAYGGGRSIATQASAPVRLTGGASQPLLTAGTPSAPSAVAFESDRVSLARLDLTQGVVVPSPASVASSQVSVYQDQTAAALTPNAMRAAITSAGTGINRCWGDTVRFRSAVADLRVGRVVSLAASGDNDAPLSVGYLALGTETAASVVPIGVTQNTAAAAGDPVDVCVAGLTTAIFQASSGFRGAQVIASTTSDGLVRAAIAGTQNEARVGFLVESGSFGPGGAHLIFVQPWYQPY